MLILILDIYLLSNRSLDSTFDKISTKVKFTHSIELFIPFISPSVHRMASFYDNVRCLWLSGIAFLRHSFLFIFFKFLFKRNFILIITNDSFNERIPLHQFLMGQSLMAYVFLFF